jgi:hypothetical protein
VVSFGTWLLLVCLLLLAATMVRWQRTYACPACGHPYSQPFYLRFLHIRRCQRCHHVYTFGRE